MYTLYAQKYVHVNEIVKITNIKVNNVLIKKVQTSPAYTNGVLHFCLVYIEARQHSENVMVTVTHKLDPL